MSRSTATPQRALWALAGITLVGLILRTVWATQEPLWSDEALSLVISKWPVQDLLLRPVDPTPGLYYLLHKWLIPDDASIAGVRAISIVAGTLSIPAIYAVGRLAISRSAGLLAAALLALSPVLVDYSQEARVYALELLLVLVSAAGLLAWAKHLGRPGGGFGLATFGVATVLAYSAHLASIFWVIPAVLLAFWATFRRGTPSQKRWFVLCATLMAIGSLLETERLLWRVSIGGGFSWLAQASPVEALATLERTILPLGPQTSTVFALAALFLVVALVGWRIAANRGEWRAWAAEHEVAAGVVAVMLLAPVGVWLIGFVLVPIYMPRTILIAIPGFILLLALLVHVEGKPWLGAAFILVFASSLLLTGPLREKEDWRTVATALRSDARPGDVIIACAGWKYPALRHALGPMRDVTAVTVLGEKVLVMEAPIGSDHEWVRSYFRTMVEPLMRSKMKQTAALPAEPAFTKPFRMSWFVESECDEDQRRIVRSWLGQGHWTLALDRPPATQHAGIALWRFDGGPVVARPVLALRD